MRDFMARSFAATLAIAAALATFPTVAAAQEQDDPLAPAEPLVTPTPAPPQARVIPVPTDWRGVFAALRENNWPGAAAGIAALPDGPLKPVAQAELYTARGSPRASLPQILDLLAAAPDLPQALPLQRLAIARGAAVLPALPLLRPTIFLGSSPRRQRAKGVTGESAAASLRSDLEPLVDANDAEAAEALYNQQNFALSPEARAEAAQRVAWIYYILGRDGDARRLADHGRLGDSSGIANPGRVAASGEWAGHAAWIAGLAAWRMNDCAAAGSAFHDTARFTTDRELAAAGHYWAARSAQMCRRPAEVEPLLRAAARFPDSFYGLVARETLGMATRLDPLPADVGVAATSANAVRARELVRIGETRLADSMLRHQARIGSPAEHRQLVRLAAQLGLPGTQYWLAHNGPAGTTLEPAARFPLTNWAPPRGWRIDPALGLAHTRQESDFRSAVISPAGAVGLMQVRPGTAGDIARARGTSVSQSALTDPATNLEYGQSFIEMMRAKPATGGQLMKIIAAYNAGPLPVDRWNLINAKGDPLLWVESLSYWETRYYVPSVLRNMFVYQGLAGRDQPALKAIAEHRWPAFPTPPAR